MKSTGSTQPARQQKKLARQYRKANTPRRFRYTEKDLSQMRAKEKENQRG